MQDTILGYTWAEIQMKQNKKTLADKAEQLIKPTGDPKIFYVEYSTKTGRTRTVVGDWGTCFEKAMKLV